MICLFIFVLHLLDFASFILHAGWTVICVRFICGRVFTMLSKLSWQTSDAEPLEGNLADGSRCFSRPRLEAIARVSLG